MTLIKLWTSEKADWRKGSGQLCSALQMATLNEIGFENMEVRYNLDKGTLEKRRSHYQTRNWRADEETGKCVQEIRGSVLQASPHSGVVWG